MSLALILEDDPADLRRAEDFTRRAGFTAVQAFHYASDARAFLENALNGRGSLPDAMIIDLDLGVESGFEILRFWHTVPELRVIPVVVWTFMSVREREICRLFGVQNVLSKEEGPERLIQSIAALLPDRNNEQNIEEPA